MTAHRLATQVPLYDGLGSARAQTNSQQSVTATLTPDGFGQTVASTGSTSSPYGYAGDWGYRTEGDAGLMHVGARYYDAQVGRFVSRDTYLDQHPYLYCEHDPANLVDPSGAKPINWKEVLHWPFVGGISLIVGGVVGGATGSGAGFALGEAIGLGVGELLWQLVTDDDNYSALGTAARAGGTPFIPW